MIMQNRTVASLSPNRIQHKVIILNIYMFIVNEDEDSKRDNDYAFTNQIGKFTSA